MPAQRRKDPRFPLNAWMRCSTSAQQDDVVCSVVDISFGGVRLSCAVPPLPEIGEIVELHFVTIQEDLKQLVFEAEVVHRAEDGSFGGRFVNLSQECRQALIPLINREDTGRHRLGDVRERANTVAIPLLQKEELIRATRDGELPDTDGPSDGSDDTHHDKITLDANPVVDLPVIDIELDEPTDEPQPPSGLDSSRVPQICMSPEQIPWDDLPDRAATASVIALINGSRSVEQILEQLSWFNVPRLTASKVLEQLLMLDVIG